MTRLGDSIVAIEVVRAFAHPVPCTFALGLGTIEACEVPRVRMARRRVELGAWAYLIVVAAVHAGVLMAALHIRTERPGGERGGQRPRLVASHVTRAQGIGARDVVNSVDHLDQRAGAAQPVARQTLRGGRAKPDAVRVAPHPTPSQGAIAARNPAPCADGDCGLIETGPYDTRVDPQHAGANYQLPQRHALDLSVMTCSDDGGCNTVTGNDQRDVRAALAPHIGALRECFAIDTAAKSVAIDLEIASARVRRVASHEPSVVGDCIAGVIRQLGGLSGDDRNVTLAFAAPL